MPEKLRLPAIIAAVLIALGIVPTSTSIALWLDSALADHALRLVSEGALILKVLLVVDGILVLAISWWVAINAAAGRTFQPLWRPAPAAAPDWVNRYFTPLLVTIVGVGLVLRSVGLNTDLWMDEVFTLVRTVRPEYGQIFAVFADDNQHTLFSLLAKLTTQLFGEHPWSLRLPAMLFGVASLWAIASVSRLVFGPREALLTALLCCVSYHHIWFSQNARAYTILLFITITATECLLRGLNTGRWRYWVGYAVLIALGAFAHLTAVFIAVAHAVVIAALLLKERRLGNGGWQPLAALALSGWLTLHLYALMIPQLVEFFSQPGAGSSTANVAWTSPIWLVSETFRQLHIHVAAGWTGLVAGLLVGCWIGYLFLRRDWVFTLVAILPAILTGLIMLGLGRSLWPRLFFNELGFVALFVVTTLVAAGDYLRRRYTIPAPVAGAVSSLPALLLCLASTAMLPKLYSYPKQAYTAARDFVLQQRQPGDQVVGLHMAGRVYSLYYQPDWPELNTVEELHQYTARSGYTWVLYTLPGYIKSARPELAQVLATEFEIVKQFPGTLGDGVIIVCRSKNTTERP